MHHFIALSSVLISTSMSSQIECNNGANQCSNDSVSCPPDEHCTVHCNGDSSCSSATIECPSARSCSIYCHDEYSCSGLTVSAADSSSLDIHGHGDQSMSGSLIHCPSGADTACDIKYNDDGDGLDSVEIYAVDLATVHIQCSSPSHCWAEPNNPRIHYGSEYLTTCTVTTAISKDPTECALRPQLLSAEAVTTLFPVIVATELVLFEEVVATEDAADIALSHHSNAVFLVLIGLCGGVLLSICCGVLCCYYWTNRRIGGGQTLEIKVNDRTPVIRPQRFKLSPSLQKLSPALTPSTKVELSRMSPMMLKTPHSVQSASSRSPTAETNVILQNLASMGSLPSKQILSPYAMPPPDEMPDFIGDHIVRVTVGRYENEKNECDESPIYSTDSEVGAKQLSPYTLHEVYNSSFADVYKLTVGGQLDGTPTAGEFEIVGDSDGAQSGDGCDGVVEGDESTE